MNRFTDPRPYLADSHIWTSLLRETAYLPNRQRAKRLYFLLWGFRYYGATITRTLTEIKLLPICYPEGAWLDKTEFDEFKTMFLKPYARELKEIIQRLEA